jgi:hypothetical protein
MLLMRCTVRRRSDVALAPILLRFGNIDSRHALARRSSVPVCWISRPPLTIETPTQIVAAPFLPMS